MLKQLTILEFLVGLAFVVLAAGEIVMLERARRRGKTRNRSRLVTHGATILIVAIILAYGQYWYHLVLSAEFFGTVGDKPVMNWPILLLGFVAFLLSLFEVLALFEARRSGRTDNLNRLFSHGAMLLLLLALASISMQKWDLYLSGFQTVYERGIPTSSETP